MSKNQPFITDEQVIQTYDRLKSMRKTADELAIGRMRVRLLLYRNGITPDASSAYNKEHQLYAEGIQLEILHLHNKGMSIKDLRNRFGGSWSAITMAILRNGGQIQPGVTTKKNLTAQQKTEIIERYLAGESEFQISNSIHLSQSSISALLRSNGVVTRGNLIGANHPKWKGGTHIDGGGYRKVKIWADDPMKVMRSQSGHVPEHRLVMARQLGRPLRPSETVHHVNGDKLDNRIENLQLRQGKHGKGVVVMCCGDCGSTNLKSMLIA